MRGLTGLFFAAALSVGGVTAGEEPSALRECTSLAASRIEVGPCLDKKLALAEAELSAATQEVHERMLSLDQITGRPVAASAFEESEKAFVAFRERNCAFLSAKVGAGTGAGDVLKDCAIEMTRARTVELRSALGPAGAALSTESGEGGPPGLTGQDFRLKKLVLEGRTIALAPESAPTIRFDGKGMVEGNATLNRYRRGYEVLPFLTLRFTGQGMAMTRMAGPPELMDQEDRFLSALDRVERVRLEGDTLILEDGKGTTVLTFARAGSLSPR